MTITMNFDCFRNEWVVDRDNGSHMHRRRFPTRAAARAAEPDAVMGKGFHFGCEHDPAR